MPPPHPKQLKTTGSKTPQFKTFSPLAVAKLDHVIAKINAKNLSDPGYVKYNPPTNAPRPINAINIRQATCNNALAFAGKTEIGMDTIVAKDWGATRGWQIKGPYNSTRTAPNIAYYVNEYYKSLASSSTIWTQALRKSPSSTMTTLSKSQVPVCARPRGKRTTSSQDNPEDLTQWWLPHQHQRATASHSPGCQGACHHLT